MPIISEETHQRLLEDFGLDMPQKTQDIIGNITGERKQSPWQTAQSITSQVFRDLMAVNRPLIQTIDEELKKQEPYEAATDTRTIGMAIVLRAFDINSQHDLTSRFSNLQPTDLEVVRIIIQQGLVPINTPILRRLLSTPRIPEQQVALNNIVNKVGSYGGGLNIFVQEGASIMYNTLSRLWPKLYPNQTPNQPPPDLLNNP